MKIIIIGLGTIGRTVVKELAGEGHTITVIDEDKDKVDSLIEKYDVFGVVGNGASAAIQKEAKVKSADIVIALSGSDELNIFACLVAKKAGVANTIARVRNPDYRQQIIDMKDELGISMIVNPERETANEVFKLIDLPSVTDMETFAKGKVSLVEITVDKDCALIGETLTSMGRRLEVKVIICAVQRGDEVIIPSGHFMFRLGDKVYLAADSAALGTFLSDINVVKQPLKHIMIVGGGRISYYLAEALSKKRRYKIKLIVNDKQEAESFADLLPRVTVVHGNGTQHGLLLEEGIEAMDAFVSLTDIDEENLVVSMFANKMNVKKTIAQIKSEDLFGILGEVGIDNNVSPKQVVAESIIKIGRASCRERVSPRV